MARGWQPDDPRLQPSDVQSFATSQPWYDPSKTWADMYPDAIRLLNTPCDLRRRFLMQVLYGVSKPSQGYADLADLAKRGYLRTVLTVNFDDLFQQAYGHGPLLVVSNSSEYHVINTSPPYPQLIYLHGQADYYMDRLMAEEVEQLDPELADRVLPLIRDHPFLVVGYRGAEPSITKGLLTSRAQQAGRFPNGIFWCIRGTPDQEPLTPLLQELAGELGDSFALVQIRGFDEFAAEFRRLLLQEPPPHRGSTSMIDPVAASRLPFDLRPSSGVAPADLNCTLLQATLREHASRMNIAPPEQLSDDWMQGRMMEIGLLARDTDGILRPTNAAVLLFTDRGRTAAPGAWTEIRTPDRPPKAIDGPLIRQYERLVDTLQEVNRPVRVKQSRSEYQLPYGAIALKEFLANAIIHRSYETREPFVVSIERDCVRFENPGGLDESLIAQLRRFPAGDDNQSPIDLFEERIRSGDAGPALSAYRNPIIAEMFWGLGYVDKVGSGLVQAVQSLRELGADVKIGIPESTDRFVIATSLGQLRIDVRTHTAVPLRPSLYHSNVLEILHLPSWVWAARSRVRGERDLVAIAGHVRLPSCVPRGDRLFTFADLTDPGNPLSSFIDSGLAQPIERDELLADPATSTVVPDLLRRMLEQRMRDKGVRVDRTRARAHFACYERVARSISYMGPRRERSRRMAWWPDGLRNGYCVHKALNYHLERFGSTWAVLLQPTFLVTIDGKGQQPPGRSTRVG